MRSSSAARNTIALLALPLLVAGPAKAITALITPTDSPTSNGSWPTGVTYTDNFGYAFKTGSSGPFDVEGINISLFSSNNSTTGSLTIAIHGTNNETPYSAIASATAYATDTVNFTKPGAASTDFALNLTAAELPNITAYKLLSNTSYSLIAYAPSAGFTMRRTTGYASGTTNDKYTVSNGFTVLDTFRDNVANYANITGSSHPTFHFTLLGSSSSAPSTAVPGPLPILGALAGFRASRQMRKRLKASKPGSTTSTTA
jgi:hypothetical protein